MITKVGTIVKNTNYLRWPRHKSYQIGLTNIVCKRHKNYCFARKDDDIYLQRTFREPHPKHGMCMFQRTRTGIHAVGAKHQNIIVSEEMYVNAR